MKQECDICCKELTNEDIYLREPRDYNVVCKNHRYMANDYRVRSINPKTKNKNVTIMFLKPASNFPQIRSTSPALQNYLPIHTVCRKKDIRQRVRQIQKNGGIIIPIHIQRQVWPNKIKI